MIERDYVRPDTLDNVCLHILPQLRATAPHVRALLNDAAFITGEPYLASRCSRMLAEQLFTEGQMQAAQTAADQAVEIARRLLGSDADNSIALVEALSAQTQAFTMRGRNDEALSSAKEGLACCELLCQSHPVNLMHQRELGIALANVGKVLENKGAQDKALAMFEQSRKISEGLNALSPDNLIYLRDLSIAINHIGRVHENKGELDNALGLFEHTRKISSQLCQLEPSNIAVQRDLGIALGNAGRMHECKGELDKALELFEQTREISSQLCQLEPGNLAHRRDLGIAINNLGRVHLYSGQLDKSLELFEQGSKIFCQLCQLEPDNMAHQRDLTIAVQNVGRVRERRGEQDNALELFEQCRQIWTRLCTFEPDNIAHQRSMGISIENLGRVCETKGKLHEALEMYEQVRVIRDRLCALEPNNIEHLRDLGILLVNIGRVFEKKGDQHKALELFEQSRKICDRLCALEPGNLLQTRELAVSNFYIGRQSIERDIVNAFVSLQRAVHLLQGLIEQKMDWGSLTGDLEIVSSWLESARDRIPELANAGIIEQNIVDRLQRFTKTKSLWAKELQEATTVETWEGLKHAKAGDYLCRGIHGEYWPQTSKKLLEKYLPSEEIDRDGWQRFDPRPDTPAVQAASIDHPFRVIGTWGEFVGKPGDYLVRSVADPQDIWIVDQQTFEATYDPEPSIQDR